MRGGSSLYPLDLRISLILSWLTPMWSRRRLLFWKFFLQSLQVSFSCLSPKFFFSCRAVEPWERKAWRPSKMKIIALYALFDSSVLGWKAALTARIIRPLEFAFSCEAAPAATLETCFLRSSSAGSVWLTLHSLMK